MELSKEYDVSRVTVRQATNNLAAKGCLIRNQGRGTYVAEPIHINRTTNIKSFTEELGTTNKKVTSEVAQKYGRGGIFSWLYSNISISRLILNKMKFNLESNSLKSPRQFSNLARLTMNIQFTYDGLSAPAINFIDNLKTHQPSHKRVVGSLNYTQNKDRN